MAKVYINVDTRDIQNLNHNDILMYDSDKNMFYKMTPTYFFKEYETKLDNLLTRYDEKVKVVVDDNQKFKEDIRKEMDEFKNIMKDLNAKMLNMIENFIKSEG